MSKFNKGDIVSSVYGRLTHLTKGEVIDPQPNWKGQITVKWPTFNHINDYGVFENDLELVKPATPPSKFKVGDRVERTVKPFFGPATVVDPRPYGEPSNTIQV